MPNGFAVPLFYLIVGAIWVFVKMTTSRERRAMLDWTMIAVVCFGTLGFLFDVFTG